MAAPQCDRGAAVAWNPGLPSVPCVDVRRGPTGLAVRVDTPVAWWVRRVGARCSMQDEGRWGLDRQDDTPSVLVLHAPDRIEAIARRSVAADYAQTLR